MKNKLRFGLVTDVHYGPNMDTRAGETAIELLQRAVDILNHEKVSFVVDLGDRINDTDLESDRVRVQRVHETYQALECPVYYVYGNHDLVNLSKEEYGEIIGKKEPRQIFDAEGYTVVLADSTDPVVDRVGGSFSEEQRQWLSDALTRVDGKVLFCSHHPIDNQDFSSHWYFSKFPHHALGHHREDVNRVLQDKILAAFCGHMHWIRKVASGGATFFTIPSFIDIFLTGQRPPGFFAVVEVEGDKVSVELRTVEGVFMKI